jgi:hypothetical protein
MPELQGRVSNAHFRTYGRAHRNAERVPQVRPADSQTDCKIFTQNAHGRESRRRRLFAKRGDRDPATRDGVEGARRDLALFTSI